MQNESDEIQWSSFPVWAETNSVPEFVYGVEGEQNCTIAMIDDSFFHLLEFYVHSNVPMSCRVPAWREPVEEESGDRQGHRAEVEAERQQEYIPLVFALAGTLQLSHMHVSTHLNVLLRSSYEYVGDVDARTPSRSNGGRSNVRP